MSGKNLYRSCLLFLSLGLLLTIYVSAISDTGQGELNPEDGSVGGSIPNVAGDHLSSGMMNTLKEMLSWFVHFLAYNPTIYDGGLVGDYAPITRIVLLIIVPIYELTVLLIGIYFIFVSMVPARMAHAKQLITKLLIGMVLAAMAPMIFQVLLDIEHAIVMEIFDSGFPSGWSWDSLLQSSIAAFAALFVGAFICTLAPMAILFTLLAIIMIGVRIMMVQALAILFPAAIALYTFDYTKGIGAKLIRYTIIWIFIPVVQSVFFVIMISSMMSLSPLIGSIMAISSFVMILISPLMMTGLMEHVGGITVATGMFWGSSRMVGFGYLLSGSGPGALMAAGSRVGYAAAGAMGGGSKPRPGVKRSAGLIGAYKAVRGGEGARGAASSFFFGRTGEAGHTNIGSQKRAQAFNAGGIGGKTKAILGEAAAGVLQPVGRVFLGLGHEGAYTVPKFMKKPFQTIGKALGGKTGEIGSVRNVGRGIMDTLAKMPTATVARTAAISLAMLTPLGFTGVGLGIGATLGLQAFARRSARKKSSAKGGAPKGGPSKGGSGAGGKTKGGPGKGEKSKEKASAKSKDKETLDEKKQKLAEKRAEYDNRRLDTLPDQAFGNSFEVAEGTGVKGAREELGDSSVKAKKNLADVKIETGSHKGKDIVQITNDINKNEDEMAEMTVALEVRTGISAGRSRSGFAGRSKSKRFKGQFGRWAHKRKKDTIRQAIAGGATSEARKLMKRSAKLTDFNSRQQGATASGKTRKAARIRVKMDRLQNEQNYHLTHLSKATGKSNEDLQKMMGKPNGEGKLADAIRDGAVTEADRMVKLSDNRKDLLNARDELRGRDVEGPTGRLTTAGELHDRVSTWDETLEMAQKHDKILEKQEREIPLSRDEADYLLKVVEPFQYERNREAISARYAAISLQSGIVTLNDSITKQEKEQEKEQEKQPASPPEAKPKPEPKPKSKPSKPLRSGELPDPKAKKKKKKSK